jgi:MFS family permease
MSASPATAFPQSESRASTVRLLSYSYFTFICYLTIGLPLAVLPSIVHLGMGYGTVIAGLVISIQYIATFISRPWVGHFCDRSGARIAVIAGLTVGFLSGVLLIAAAFAVPHSKLLGLLLLLLCRLVLGVGESLTSTGSTLWSISANGPHNTAKVISFNGVSTYGGLALGAPLGVWISSHWGLNGIAVLVMVMGFTTVLLAIRKPSTPIIHGKQLPFRAVFQRVAMHGTALALGGVGFSELSTFVTLYYASRHWAGAALCLTAFGCTFIVARLLFINTIQIFGAFRVAMVSLSVELCGLVLIWAAATPTLALLGSALTGLGYSLVFPSLGLEAVRRVPEQNRGAALGIYTGFVDVSFFLAGPSAGAIIGLYGYGSVFVFAMIAVMLALGFVFMLASSSRKLDLLESSHRQ